MFGYAGIAVRIITFLSVFFFILSGCSSGKPKPVDYHIYSEADSSLNRDASARSLSVVLNVYQLKDRGAFVRLTFEDFVSGRIDSELLGEDLLQKSEVVVLPGDKQSLGMKLLPETQYLGVVAIYRTPADQQWRYLIPADQIRKTSFWKMSDEKTIALRLHDCHMSVDGVTVDLIPGQKKSLEPVCPAAAQVSTTGNGSL